MMIRVAKILSQRIDDFMKRILADDAECVDENHVHEEIRESSLLFKEIHYGR